MTKSPPWQEWLDENGSRLMLYARQQTRSEADAEDVLQEALVKTWKATEGRIDDSITGLVYTNIRRCAIDLARGNQRRRAREDQVALDAGDPVSWFELPDDDEARQLQVALASIPGIYSEVITLKIWGGLTFAQIGETLDISPNTAASRYRYGLEALRTRLSHNKADLLEGL